MVLMGASKYLKHTWDREQTQAAFVSDRDDVAATPAPKSAHFKLYHWPRGTAAATELVSSATTHFPAAFTVSDKGTIAFSRDGKKLYVPAAPPQVRHGPLLPLQDHRDAGRGRDGDGHR
jgi:hypothetical protein